MLRTQLAMFLLGLMIQLASAAQPKDNKDKTPPPIPPAVRFPEIAPSTDITPPSPPPVVDPTATVSVGPGQYYVIRSKSPLVVRQSPNDTGTAKIMTYKRPLMLPAAQTVGWRPANPDDEFITFDDVNDNFLYVVKAAKSGQANLLVIPAVNKATVIPGKGAEPPTLEQVPLADADIVVKTITLVDGTGPIPPPKPKVDPSVDPKPVVPSGDLRVLIVYESAQNLTAKQLDVINSTKLRGWLNANCVKDADGKAGWKSIDKDLDFSKQPKVWQDIWRATKPSLGKLPQIVIIRGTEGKNYELPDTEDAAIDLIKVGG